MISDRYFIQTRQIAAPGRGTKYYYPAEVRVYDSEECTHQVYGYKGVVWKQKVCGTQYKGPRSQYGKALKSAKQVVREMNEKELNLITLSCVI